MALNTLVFYDIFPLEKILFSKGLAVVLVTMPVFDSSSFGDAMNLCSRLWRRFSCMRGMHQGGNFCIYCGKQLAAAPFLSYRVFSCDGQLNIVVKARNAHHAKRQLQDRYPPSSLIAQRATDD